MSSTTGNTSADAVAVRTTPHSKQPALERIAVAAAATLVPSLLLVHVLAALLQTKPGSSPFAVVVSSTVIAVGLLHAFVEWRWPRVPAWGWMVAPFAAAALLAATTDGVAGALSVAACSSIQGWAQSRVARALPPAIDGQIGTRPWRTFAWSLLAVLAVAQTARLASHEADPEVSWWVTTRNPAWTSHLCSSAYIYAADLHDQGETNIYDLSHYPAFDPSAVPHPTVANLAGHVECAFQYPPPFLLLPWTALRVTHDFSVLRPLWLALQGLGFLAVAFALCRWIGGPRGRLAAWLIPAIWVAVPTLQNFAFGQFHLSAIALGLAGMLAFEMRRTSLGGALLGAAVVTKLYPAVLLLLLASQRRWRELAATLTWIAAFGILGLALLGPAPYQAFLFDHVPRLLDGSAFDSPHWDEAAKEAMVAINLGVSAVPDRLRLIGVELRPAQLGPWLSHTFGLVILALVWRAGRRETSRTQALILWLALLNLVVLQGPAAFVDYVPVTSIWLLTFVSGEMGRNRPTAIVLGICWLHFATLLGTFPIPDDMSEDWTEAISLAQVSTSTLLMTLFLIALNLWCVLRTNLDLDRQASLERLAEPADQR